MFRLILSTCLALAAAMPARADDMIAVRSSRPVTETLDRLQAVVTAGGFSIVGRVPHSEAARGVGLTLRPTELLIFGRPQGGTPIMACNQRAGIDLPLRALSWQDEAGQVWLGMINPQSLKQRWDLPAACDAPLSAMEAGVRRFMTEATAP